MTFLNLVPREVWTLPLQMTVGHLQNCLILLKLIFVNRIIVLVLARQKLPQILRPLKFFPLIVILLILSMVMVELPIFSSDTVLSTE